MAQNGYKIEYMNNNSHIETSSQSTPAQPLTPLDPAIARRVAETFAALADPTRIRILSVLIDQELGVNQIARLIGLSESATSHQLRLLRILQIVRTRKAGRKAFYKLDDDHIRDLIQRAIEHTQHTASE
jgi:DNA-binding transcriptional ArsR family regulator